VEQHRVFTAKIPELEDKLLTSKDYTSAQEVTIYLTDWLLNHIIEEDIPAVTIFKKCGLTEKEKLDRSLLARLIRKTTDKFSFTKRIFLSAMVPLSGMLLFGSIIILENYDNYLDMKEISAVTHITSDINELVHHLQIERGLSSGYLVSEKNKFKNILQRQRKIVDNSNALFNKKILNINANNIKVIMPHINNFYKDNLALDNLRRMVDDKVISQASVIKIYTDTIENILNITPKIAYLNIDKELSSSIATLASIQHLKESLGQERAYGTIIIEKKEATTKEYVAFARLLGTQVAFLNTFEHTASAMQKSISDSINSSSITKLINDYERKVINRKYNELDSEIWFKSTTEFIDKIKLFEDELLFNINELVDSRIDETITNFLMWIIFNTIILFITLFMLYTFKKSTKMQIYKLTKAMRDLASGGRSLRLSPINLNRDELAYMYDAYETTRQKLLRGDIYTELYLTKKEIELKNEQRENLKLEEMAFIDPLTGAINRRKFEVLSQKELKRAIRYKSFLSFLMLDIDHFKEVNDTYGHAIGDEVLKHFSSVCLDMARSLDIVARIGGEEFIVMLPETDSDGAYMFAERFRKKIFNSTLEIEGKTIKYSVSIGISILDANNDEDISSVIQRADKALYNAKEAGRNTTIIYK